MNERQQSHKTGCKGERNIENANDTYSFIHFINDLKSVFVTLLRALCSSLSSL